MDGHFSIGDISNQQVKVKTYSTTLIILEMPVKLTVSYPHLLVWQLAKCE